MDTRKSPIVKPTAFGVGLSEITYGVDLNQPNLYLNSCRSDLYLFRHFIWFPINAQRTLLESEEFFKPKHRGRIAVSIPPRIMIDVGRHVQGDTVRERAWRDRGEI